MTFADKLKKEGVCDYCGSTDLTEQIFMDYKHLQYFRTMVRISWWSSSILVHLLSQNGSALWFCSKFCCCGYDIW